MLKFVYQFMKHVCSSRVNYFSRQQVLDLKAFRHLFIFLLLLSCQTNRETVFLKSGVFFGCENESCCVFKCHDEISFHL